ncbi:MAG: FliH/SctL family protein [Woeseiaceae bacterium]
MSEETDTAVPWDVPTIDVSENNGFLTAARLQALQKEAYDEAWAKGLADGMREGESAAAARAERLDQILQSLSRPFEQLDEVVEEQLVDLAMAVVRQLFRREIRLEPTHIIGVVREAIRLLPIASRNVQLHLHPDDAELVRETLSPAEGEPAWVVVEDPLLTRGGCNVTTENSSIDATAESRLQAVISSLTGDERQ